MFARSISFRLKPDSIAAFTKLIEDETLPQNSFSAPVSGLTHLGMFNGGA
jgi:hypothetical protein